MESIERELSEGGIGKADPRRTEVIERPLSEDELQARLAALQHTPALEEFHEGTRLAVSDVRQAVADQRHESMEDLIEETKRRYKYVRPFAEAADNLIDYLVNTEGRFMFGLRELDVMTRGIGNGELCFITGFSHSGKTQFFLQSVVNSIHRPIVLFTLDEPSELVLAKLVGLREGWNFEWVEDRIKAQDKGVLNRVRDIAAIDFQNLVVVDDIIGLAEMRDAVEEAKDYLQKDIAAIGIDYLTVIPDGEDVEGKAQALKRWTKDVDVPVLCIHQGGKGEAGKGQPITLTSMLHGGHAEAIFMIGCRRKRDDQELDDWDRQRNTNTISISVVKNKRPPSKKGEHDYFLDPESGIIRTLEPGDPGTPLEGAGRPLAVTVPMSAILAQRAQERAASAHSVPMTGNAARLAEALEALGGDDEGGATDFESLQRKIRNGGFRD